MSEETTRRLIKGDWPVPEGYVGTIFAWCETGQHTMNPTGDRCEKCGRLVVEDEFAQLDNIEEQEAHDA